MSSNFSAEIENEKPLDPAIEAVRKRLARLMVVSIGIMMIGLLAVLGAIVYKAYGTTAPSLAGNGSLVIPAGMSVVDHSIDGDRIALRLRAADGSETITLYSISDGSIVGTLQIVPNMKN